LFLTVQGLFRQKPQGINEFRLEQVAEKYESVLEKANQEQTR
jgi:hypothetical protein